MISSLTNTIALNPRVSPKNDDKDRIHPEIKSKATYQSYSNTTDDSEIVKNFKTIPENVSFSLPKFIAGTVPGRRPYQEDRMTIHQFTILITHAQGANLTHWPCPSVKRRNAA